MLQDSSEAEDVAPRVQFFYSLQKSTLRTVVDTLLPASELSALCSALKVPNYNKSMKKRMAVDLLVEHILRLKQAHQRDQFNDIIARINQRKGHNVVGQIPQLPERIEPLNVLHRSMLLVPKCVRPTFPLRLAAPLKWITGTIFLDQTGLTCFSLDLFFSTPTDLPSVRFMLFLYQAEEPFTVDDPPRHTIFVSPTLLDLTLNGTVLDSAARFRNHDWFDITLLCYRDRPNLLRILKHESHVNQANLVIEVMAVQLSGPLSAPVENHAVVNTHASANNRVAVNSHVAVNNHVTVNNHAPAHNHTIAHTPAQKRPAPPLDDCGEGRYRALTKEPTALARTKALAHIRKPNSGKRKGGQQKHGAGSDDEPELVSDMLAVSLQCPISMQRIVRPVRFRTCRHLQCFDLDMWQALSRKSLHLNRCGSGVARAACPVCGDPLLPETELVQDGLFVEILAQTQKTNPEASVVEVNVKTGKFLPVAPDPSKMNVMAEDDEQIKVVLVGDSDTEGDPFAVHYVVDMSLPLGSCPSRAITID